MNERQSCSNAARRPRLARGKKIKTEVPVLHWSLEDTVELFTAPWPTLAGGSGQLPKAAHFLHRALGS